MLLSLCLLSLSAITFANEPVSVLDARSLSWETRCTAEALQGLANRQGPRAYLDFGASWSKQWQDIYTERNGLTFEPCTSLAAFIDKFSDCFEGFVVYDPAIDGSRYVAITLAGTDNLLPVSAELLNGSLPELLAGDTSWSGIDFTSPTSKLDGWRYGSGATFDKTDAGVWLYETDAKSEQKWTMAAIGPLSVDLDRYPYLEVKTDALEGENAQWGVKLTWDRNADGQIFGGEDDLSLDFPYEAGTKRWNIAQLGKLQGLHVFTQLQLHVAGQGARVKFQSVRFVDENGQGIDFSAALPLTQRYNKPVKVDLRGKFQNSVEAYEWALKEVMPRCDRRFAHAVNGREGDMQIGCGPFAGYDWTVLHKSFVFNLTPTPEAMESYGTSKIGGNLEHAQMYRKILAALEAPAMITGYGEPEGYWCDLLSTYGHFSFHAYDNWSLHSKVPPINNEFRQQTAWRPENVTAEPDKFYVCVMTSEGDTMKGPIPFFYDSWSDPMRGQVGMNWGINPLMAEYFPAMLEYYYATATPNDYFFVGCSGAGYVYPDKMPNLRQFAEMTGEACIKADTPCIDMWGVGKAEVQEEYARYTKPLGLTINSTPARMQLLPDGTPVAFHQLAYWQTQAIKDMGWQAGLRDPVVHDKAMDWLTQQIETIARNHYAPFIILVYPDLHSWDRHATSAKDMADRLDPARFKVTRLDEAFAAWRKVAQEQVLVSDGNDICRKLVWTIFDNVPVQVPVSLTNASNEVVTAAVTVSAGKVGAQEEVQLQPNETRKLDDILISGTDMQPGNPMNVTVQSKGNQVIREVEVAVVPAPADLQGKKIRLVNTWQAASNPHIMGNPVEDNNALFGRAWGTPASNDKFDNTFLYGPYADMPAGKYVIAFRLRLADAKAAAEAGADTIVVTLDVAAGGWDGTGEKCAEQVIKVSDLPADGSYGWIVLQGNWPGAPNLMETRAFWNGKVGCVLDRVAAFLIED